MNIDPNQFLHSLAVFMVAQAALQTPPAPINYLTTPRGLWVNKILEADAEANPAVTAPADPASVLRIHGGPGRTWDPVERVSIQCMTTTANTAAGGEPAAVRQARVLFESLLMPATDPQRPLVPRTSFSIPRYLPNTNTANPDGSFYWVVSIAITNAPGKVGVDQRLRPLIVFNFDVGFAFI